MKKLTKMRLTRTAKLFLEINTHSRPSVTDETLQLNLVWGKWEETSIQLQDKKKDGNNSKQKNMSQRKRTHTKKKHGHRTHFRSEYLKHQGALIFVDRPSKRMSVAQGLFRQVRAQGRNADAPSSSKNASGSVGIRVRHQAINPASPRKVRAWGDGSLTRWYGSRCTATDCH